MSEDPAARRARLAAMRGEAAAAGEAAATAADNTAAPVLRFRNYAVPDAAGVEGAVQVEAAEAPELTVEPVAREVVPEGAPDEVRELGDGDGGRSGNLAALPPGSETLSRDALMPDTHPTQHNTPGRPRRPRTKKAARRLGR